MICMAHEVIAEQAASAIEISGKNNSRLTCPDCSGPLMSSQDGEFLEFRCIIEHAYSPEAMRVAHPESMEDALWSAVASLREHSSLLRRLAARGCDGKAIERQAAI